MEWLRSLFQRREPPPPQQPKPEDLLALIEDVPKGFSARADAGRRTLHITYRRQGMGCMVLFLGVWLAGWTAGGAFALWEMLRNWEPFLLVWLCFWFVGEVAVGCFLAWNLCGRTEMTFEPSRLLVERVLFGWRRGWLAGQRQIAEIRQVKDGGEGDDSFPSWGLVVQADKKRIVLSRQEYEKSLWLGRVLSCWSGVAFVPAEEPD
jgi:hypothetical protein